MALWQLTWYFTTQTEKKQFNKTNRLFSGPRFFPEMIATLQSVMCVQVYVRRRNTMQLERPRDPKDKAKLTVPPPFFCQYWLREQHTAYITNCTLLSERFPTNTCIKKYETEYPICMQIVFIVSLQHLRSNLLQLFGNLEAYKWFEKYYSRQKTSSGTQNICDVDMY